VNWNGGGGGRRSGGVDMDMTVVIIGVVLGDKVFY